MHLDILVVHDRFYYGVARVSPKINYSGTPFEELKQLRNNVFNRLKSSFYTAKVTYDKPKCIQLSGGSLKRKFDILICSRFNSQEYIDTNNEHLRAISLYSLESNMFNEDYPFTHIHEVIKKNNNLLVNSNLCRIVRLLKSLKVDADHSINLSSFMITSIMYHMNDIDFYVPESKLSELLVNASLHLNKILNDEQYRLNLKSPNKKENLFTIGDTNTLSEIEKLKKELNITIADLADDFKRMDSKLEQVTSSKFQKGEISDRFYDLERQRIILTEARFSYLKGY